MGKVPGESGVLIVGTGAMACLLAARLARVARVWVLGTWREGLEALRRRGARVVGEPPARVEATSLPEACAGIPAALVLVKAWQTAQAAARLRRCLPPEGVALTLQNGLGNLETLAAALGPRRVTAGAATFGARLVAPGEVLAAGDGEVFLGPGAEGMARFLEAAGLPVRRVGDPRSALWGKLVVNAALNPVAALAGVPNGEVLRRPELRRMMAATAREAATVAAATGIGLPYTDAVAAVEEVARRTAANCCSMLTDLRRGAPTEVEAINGAVVRAGARVRIPTPRNCELLERVRARSRR